MHPAEKECRRRARHEVETDNDAGKGIYDALMGNNPMMGGTDMYVEGYRAGTKERKAIWKREGERLNGRTYRPSAVDLQAVYASGMDYAENSLHLYMRTGRISELTSITLVLESIADTELEDMFLKGYNTVMDGVRNHIERNAEDIAYRLRKRNS